MEFHPEQDGPMFDWVLACLSGRLIEMLAEAGATALAARVEPADVARRLEAVRAEMVAAAERGVPTQA
jgi:hypothetical protein